MLAGQAAQRGKNGFQIGIRRMGPDPSEHHRTVRRLASGGPKDICVYYGGNDSRLSSPAGNVFCDRAVTATDDGGPFNQIVNLAEPFQSLTLTTLARAIPRVAGLGPVPPQPWAALTFVLSSFARFSQSATCCLV